MARKVEWGLMLYSLCSSILRGMLGKAVQIRHCPATVSGNQNGGNGHCDGRGKSVSK